MRKHNLLLILTFLVTLLFVSGCSNENTNITEPDNTITNGNLEGTWVLEKINYSVGNNPVTLTNDQAGISLTFIFREDKTAQIMEFENGNTSIQHCIWYCNSVQLVLQYNDGNEEYLQYNLTENMLKIKYAFTTQEGVTVPAWYEFYRET